MFTIHKKAARQCEQLATLTRIALDIGVDVVVDPAEISASAAHLDPLSTPPS